jgi:large repetitive protein
VFFAASDGVHGRELWESDGTSEGTRMVADLAPGGYAAIPAPSTLVVANGYLFLAADDGKTGPEPWTLPLTP